jgi:hypothetical protein
MITKEGDFIVQERVIHRAATSLLCKFNNKSRTRRCAVRLIERKAFDRFIMICIVINSISMACFDYTTDNKCAYDCGTSSCPNPSRYNKILNGIGSLFGLIFLIEACLKIFALGCLSGHQTYLKNGWNLLDFVIVLGGCLEFALEWAKLPGVNMRALRTLRILRPLKAMKTIPSLRMQVSALIRSVVGLFNVIAFLCAIFMLFGIVGLQWFHGSMHYTCRQGQAPLLGAKSWEKLASHPGVCTPPDN